MLRGTCSKCRRNKSMIVSDEVKAERLGFLKKVGKAAVSFGKKVASNPVRELEIASKIGT